MSSDAISGLGAAPAAAPAGRQAPADVRAQVTQLAQEFEAMLMTQMLREMRRSMLSDDQSGGYGAEAMSDTTDVELGRALSQSGGFGLATVLQSAIRQQVTPSNADAGASAEVAGAPAAAAPPATPIATPPVSSLPALPAPSDNAAPGSAPKGPVTSPFGLRRDPFTGETRFHAGVDIGLPYGTDVRAAAGGHVVFAGVRGGYGNMVIVEQASGQQMRYAHLSAQAVRAGDAVEAGQVIGQVGDSGRATGPHLHFEVVENGHAVDPAGLQ